MKFKIVVEDKKKGTLVVPLSVKEISALGELRFFLNEIDKDMESATRKLSFLLFDVKDEGKSYPLKDGKIDHKNFSIHYLFGTPRWTKARRGAAR